MTSRPVAAVTFIADPGGGAPRGIATILPDTDPRGHVAFAEWQAHLDAGHFVSAPPRSPEWPAIEARIRETERILGIRRGTIW